MNAIFLIMQILAIKEQIEYIQGQINKIRNLVVWMADSKWGEHKEEYLKSKTKSCQPERKNTVVEKTFQESA